MSISTTEDTYEFKQVRSEDTANLTGGQIQEILDQLIFQSLAPIVRTTDVFDIQIIHLLGQTAKNRKRKLTALNRDDFITTLSHCLITDDREKKINLLTSAKIERGFVYNFVVNFLDSVSGYIDVYHKHLLANGTEKEILDRQMSEIEVNIRADRSSLYTTINIAQDYLNLAYKFRNSIVGNYLRHSFKQAKAFCRDKGSNFDFNCVHQNFLTAIIKAVDKYDCSKGALTSYINYWLLNAQTTNNSDHGHEYGIAFTIPQLQRKAMAVGGIGGSNYGISIDAQVESDDGVSTNLKNSIVGDSGVDEELEQTQEEDNIKYLIKAADVKGMARLYLDLDEVFSQREYKRMRKIMNEQQTKEI